MTKRKNTRKNKETILVVWGDSAVREENMRSQGMTDEELRIRVAELSGWERGPKKTFSLGKFGIVPAMSAWHPKSSKEDWQDFPPDFPNDLEAMHEAEAAIPDNDGAQAAYHAALCKVTNWAPVHCSISQAKANFDLIHATARARAEAFVMAMEEQP